MVTFRQNGYDYDDIQVFSSTELKLTLKLIRRLKDWMEYDGQTVDRYEQTSETIGYSLGTLPLT